MRKMFATLISLPFLLLFAAPAFAHGDIERVRPEPEQVKAKAPDHVAITFTEAPTKDAKIAVTDGCGIEQTREKYVQGRTLHVFLKKGQPGDWTVSYSVISAVDGHKTNGKYSFSVKGKTDCSAPEPEPSETSAAEEPDVAAPTTPTADDSGGIPVAVVGVGILALIGIAFLVRMGASKD